MKLQPLDIRRQSFAKAFRGYEPVEVDAFLKQVADQQAALMEEVRMMEERVRDAESKLKHYERVELALQEALETARDSGKRAEATAERELRSIVQRAEARAEEILRDAERERFSLQQDVRKLSTRQAEVAAKLRGFLMSELEILAQFQGDDPIGFLKLQPASVQGALPAPAPADAPRGVDDAPAAVPDEPTPEPEETPADELPDESPLVSLDPPAGATTRPETREVAADDATQEEAPADDPPVAGDPGSSSFARWFGNVPAAAGPADEPASAPAPADPFEPVAVEAPTAGVPEPPAADPVPEVAPADPAPAADAPQPGPPSPATPPSFAPLPTVAAPSEPAPPAWDLRSLVTGGADDTNVAGSEAERDRIRRILDDLD